jgi:hypothetical protein
MILFEISTWASIGCIPRWGSGKNQTKIDIKSVWFRSFGSWTESTVCSMYSKALYIIVHYSIITLRLIWLKTAAHIAEEGPWNASSCIWAMHLLTIRDNFVNISKDLVLVEFWIRPTQTWPKWFLPWVLKAKLVGLMIQSRKELILIIQQIFDEILRETYFCLSFVYKRFKWAIEKCRVLSLMIKNSNFMLWI